MTPFQAQLVAAAHDPRRLALAGRRVGAPDAEPPPAGRDLLEVGAAQRLVGQQLDALDRVVVAVDDAPDRAVGLRHGAHELPLAGDRSAPAERPGLREDGHGVVREGRLAVARGGAGGDLRQGALHGGDGVGAHVATDSAAIMRVKRTVSSQP